MTANSSPSTFSYVAPRFEPSKFRDFTSIWEPHPTIGGTIFLMKHRFTSTDSSNNTIDYNNNNNNNNITNNHIEMIPSASISNKINAIDVNGSFLPAIFSIFPLANSSVKSASCPSSSSSSTHSTPNDSSAPVILQQQHQITSEKSNANNSLISVPVVSTNNDNNNNNNNNNNKIQNLQNCETFKCLHDQFRHHPSLISHVKTLIDTILVQQKVIAHTNVSNSVSTSQNKNNRVTTTSTSSTGNSRLTPTSPKDINNNDNDRNKMKKYLFELVFHMWYKEVIPFTPLFYSCSYLLNEDATMNSINQEHEQIFSKHYYGKRHHHHHRSSSNSNQQPQQHHVDPVKLVDEYTRENLIASSLWKLLLSWENKQLATSSPSSSPPPTRQSTSNAADFVAAHSSAITNKNVTTQNIIIASSSSVSTSVVGLQQHQDYNHPASLSGPGPINVTLTSTSSPHGTINSTMTSTTTATAVSQEVFVEFVLYLVEMLIEISPFWGNLAAPNPDDSFAAYCVILERIIATLKHDVVDEEGEVLGREMDLDLEFKPDEHDDDDDDEKQDDDEGEDVITIGRGPQQSMIPKQKMNETERTDPKGHTIMRFAPRSQDDEDGEDDADEDQAEQMQHHLKRHENMRMLNDPNKNNNNNNSVHLGSSMNRIRNNNSDASGVGIGVTKVSSASLSNFTGSNNLRSIGKNTHNNSNFFGTTMNTTLGEETLHLVNGNSQNLVAYRTLLLSSSGTIKQQQSSHNNNNSLPIGNRSGSTNLIPIRHQSQQKNVSTTTSTTGAPKRLLVNKPPFSPSTQKAHQEQNNNIRSEHELFQEMAMVGANARLVQVPAPNGGTMSVVQYVNVAEKEKNKNQMTLDPFDDASKNKIRGGGANVARKSFFDDDNDEEPVLTTTNHVDHHHHQQQQSQESTANQSLRVFAAKTYLDSLRHHNLGDNEMAEYKEK